MPIPPPPPPPPHGDTTKQDKSIKDIYIDSVARYGATSTLIKDSLAQIYGKSGADYGSPKSSITRDKYDMINGCFDAYCIMNAISSYGSINPNSWYFRGDRMAHIAHSDFQSHYTFYRMLSTSNNEGVARNFTQNVFFAIQGINVKAFDVAQSVSTAYKAESEFILPPGRLINVRPRIVNRQKQEVHNIALNDFSTIEYNKYYVEYVGQYVDLSFDMINMIKAFFRSIGRNEVMQALRPTNIDLKAYNQIVDSMYS